MAMTMAARLPLVVAAVMGLLQPLAGAQGTSTPKFRSATSVVAVTAVVRDQKGRFVRDLAKKDFAVAESGQPKPIIDFREQSDGPVKLAMLFDVSGSMRVGSRAADAKDAARLILSTLRADDEAGLFAFDTQLVRVHDFTSNATELTAALNKVDPPYGQTSLYDAVAGAAREVVKSADAGHALPQRRAVVVLTDGVDTRSRLTPAEVTSIASQIDVPVYVLAVLAAIDDPKESRREAEQEGALRSVAQWTGGDVFITSAPAHTSVAARRIVDELRHQYVLAFEASPHPGWHPLEIRALKRNLVVRARAGYTAGGSASGPADNLTTTSSAAGVPSRGAAGR
jgi:VWFA-related protein